MKTKNTSWRWRYIVSPWGHHGNVQSPAAHWYCYLHARFLEMPTRRTHCQVPMTGNGLAYYIVIFVLYVNLVILLLRRVSRLLYEIKPILYSFSTGSRAHRRRKLSRLARKEYIHFANESLHRVCNNLFIVKC